MKRRIVQILCHQMLSMHTNVNENIIIYLNMLLVIGQWSRLWDENDRYILVTCIYSYIKQRSFLLL